MRFSARRPELPLQQGREDQQRLARYVQTFNARDWDGLRAMLADDARLDLVGRSQRLGSAQVGNYFSNYDAKRDWRVALASAEGQLAAAAYDPTADADEPACFVLVQFDATGRVAAIRDFRYARDVLQDASLVPIAPVP